MKSLIQIEQKRKVLQLATMEPFKEPARPLSHWDFVLKEMRWMAVDFTEASAVLQRLCCVHPALPDAYHLAAHSRLPPQLGSAGPLGTICSSAFGIHARCHAGNVIILMLAVCLEDLCCM